MKTRAELKQIAKNRLKENWGWAIGNCVLPSLIIGTVFIALFYLLLLPIALNGDTAEPTGAVAVSMVLMTVLYFLMIFISLLAEVSIVCIFLDFIRGKKKTYLLPSSILLLRNVLVNF
ncbi:hypothetical protein N1495_00815 [Streptococcus didelphis]|uniref:hypothetical protein n=1 Tax=Streptococcus didelphis TaxID=102886 RepID=UPI0027D2D849|nr:hypothetical protein [Streptococcus didelphis]WMB29618.1 hypothetical protein N1495_00815 [Streptococcus didelphis]